MHKLIPLTRLFILGLFLKTFFVIAEDTSQQQLSASPEDHPVLNGCSELPVELRHLTTKMTSSRLPSKKARWTILVYMVAENSLQRFAVSNIEDMVKANSSDNVNLIIQIDRYGDSKTHRLQVVNHGLVDVGSFSQPMGYKPALELDRSLDWVASTFPADHTMLVLWNHGGGVNRQFLRPLGHRLVQETENAVNFEDVETGRGDKGILYNERTGTFLSTNELGDVLSTAKKYFKGNLPILAMDACLMAMLEVCYTIKDFCDYVVASENVEQGTGWNYLDVITKIVSSGGSLTPKQFANYIVESYKNYYLQNDPEFTQSALDMSKIDNLKKAVDVFAQELIKLKNSSKIIFKQFFEDVYRYIIKYEKDYVDLLSICDLVDDTIGRYVSFYSNRPNSGYSTNFVAAAKNLQSTLPAVRKAIQEVVLVSYAGFKLQASCGISIYLPQIYSGRIESDYATCIFAKTSPWLNFLQTASRMSLEDLDEAEQIEIPE